VVLLISDLTIRLSARIAIFRKDVDNLQVGAKANMLAILVDIGKGIFMTSLWHLDVMILTYMYLDY
jgi:hypothetical protein